MPGRLILCATPIGNLGDASPRLARVLAESDAVFVEDTRRSRILLGHLGIRKRLMSFHAGNEREQVQKLGGLLADGQTVALLTDAGTPAISDPGLSAVAEARRQGADVSIVPGPSAVTAALAVSGFPSERFVFEGFLPRREATRRGRLQSLQGEPRTMVFFSSPHHLLQDLADLGQALGERAVTVARELTKTFEEVWWGTLSGAQTEWEGREPQGEFTLVIEGSPESPPDFEEALAEVRRLTDEGMATAAAVREVARTSGVPRRELYQRAISRG